MKTFKVTKTQQEQDITKFFNEMKVTITNTLDTVDEYDDDGYVLDREDYTSELEEKLKDFSEMRVESYTFNITEQVEEVYSKYKDEELYDKLCNIYDELYKNIEDTDMLSLEFTYETINFDDVTISLVFRFQLDDYDFNLSNYKKGEMVLGSHIIDLSETRIL